MYVGEVAVADTHRAPPPVPVPPPRRNSTLIRDEETGVQAVCYDDGSVEFPDVPPAEDEY